MKRQKNRLQTIDRPLYSYWQALYLAFFSPNIYIDVAKRWRGFGLIYFLILISVISLPLGSRIAGDLNYYFKNQILYPLEQLPTLVIQNGQASFDKPMPYYVKNSADQVVAIIDTTGEITHLNNYPEAKILVSKSEMHLRFPAIKSFLIKPIGNSLGEVFVQPFSDSSNESINLKEILKEKNFINYIYLYDLMVYPCILLFSYCFLLSQFGFLSVLAQFIARMIFKMKLKHRICFRLLLVASTPQLSLLFFLLTFDIYFPPIPVVYIVCLLGYFCFALFSVKKVSQQLVFI